MANSQFTIYSSADVGAPTLNGLSGSLISVFDACLHNGYGAKVAAGWSKPFENLSSSYGDAGSGSVVGCWRAPSGSMMTLFVNDCKPNATSTGKEAWATGWETMTGMTSSVGDGGGQFPTPTQLLTTGHTVIRKSTAADSTVRQWIMFADAYTFYFFAATGDATGRYYPFWFGDVFSLKGNTDAYRCMLCGRQLENSILAAGDGTNTTSTCGDTFDGIFSYVPYGSTAYLTPLAYAQPGTFLARTYGGGGSSVAASKCWDISKSSIYYNYNPTGLLIYYGSGVLQSPNGPDNGLYMSPICIGEPSSTTLRGRFRGLWQLCHAIGNFTDGQQFEGGGDYAGKRFQVVKTCSSALGMYAIEISNTVETN